ncbi:MAG: hypothetical protein LH609_20795 [Rudanella sp.]|nr:hypothetical protein [Rudanella sp.]
MQGVSLMTDPNGKPSFLTIDLHHLNPAISPLVEEVLDLIRRADEETERADFRAAAHAALNRAYGDDEPDYDDVPAMTIHPAGHE